MTTRYKNTQIGYYLLTVYSGVIIFFLFLNQKSKNKPIARIRLLIIFVIMALFGTLSVEVNERALKLRFGVGAIRKEFLLQDIETYRSVKNPWYYGWGIRFIPQGWLFNVSGLKAVELRMKNGKTFRIGTDEPDALTDALDGALSTT